MKRLMTITSLCALLMIPLGAQNICQEEKEALMDYHQQIMDFKDGNVRFHDLLERKNRLNANLAMYDALLGIINDYYNYLGKSVNTDVKKIDELQLFLQEQAPAAHRMNLSVDMINTVSRDGDLPQTKEARFVAIKNRLRHRCTQKPNLSYCRDLGSAFWDHLDPGVRATQGANTNQMMVGNFIHLASAAEDIGKPLIDQTHVTEAMAQDPSLRQGLTAHLSAALDEAAKNCANRDLLRVARADQQGRCLDVKLSTIVSNGDGVIERELNLAGEPTLGDAFDLYFKKLASVSQSQVKLTSDALSQVLQLSSANFRSADQALNRGARQKFERDFKKKQQKLAGNIHGAFKIMAAQQSLSHALTHGLTNQSFNPRTHQLVPMINETLRELTGYEGRDLFRVDNGRLTYNREELLQLLNTNALSSRALKDKQQRDITELQQVQQQLDRLAKNDRFATLNSLREFTWSNVRYNCSRNDDEYIGASSACSQQDAYSEGLNTLLKTSYQMDNLKLTEQEQARLSRILEYCAKQETSARDHTCAQARNKKLRLTRVQEDARIRAEEEAFRRKELLSNPTHYYVRDEEGKIIGQRRRQNGYKVGLQRGLVSATQILLPTTMQYMALGPQLQMAAEQGKQEKIYRAWMNRPQYDCRIYVCPNTPYPYFQGGSLGYNSLYSPPTIAGPQGYQPFPQTNWQLGSAGNGFSIPSSGSGFNLSRPTSP